MKAGGTGRNTGGKSNVAYWVQVAIDGTGLTNEGERVKRRLESIGCHISIPACAKERY